MGQEQRSFPRVPESFAAECRLAGSGESWQAIQTINISASGMRFGSPLPYEVGTQVDFQIKLPISGRQLEISGGVVWSKSLGARVSEIAAEFNDLTPGQEIQIDELVQFLMKSPHRAPPESSGSRGDG